MSTTISAAPIVIRHVRVHPLVLYVIVDAYERRNIDQERVVGTLLGIIDKDSVIITNCFTTPHQESDQEVCMDIQYGLKMLDMCKRTNSHEKIVGWFSTGAEITNHSLLIHDYYRRETPQPVHLLVDTSLREGCRLRVAAYTSTPIGVPKKTTGVMFTPVQHVDVASTSSRPERVTLDTFIQHARDSLLRPAAPSSSTTPQSGNGTSGPLTSDMPNLIATLRQLEAQLGRLTTHVEGIAGGRMQADAFAGRALAAQLATIEQLSTDELEELMNSNVKDLLLLLYLAELGNTQLGIHERLAAYS